MGNPAYNKLWRAMQSHLHFRRLCYSTVNTAWPSHRIRTEFINFYKERNHQYVHSSSVLPTRNEGSYFINAGMNQFKPIILGTVEDGSELATYNRVVNSQKCIRVGGKHNDLDDVGKDTYHHTFFEMLGSWSFGDYFKKEACEMAWELVTNVFHLPVDRLYVTYFAGCDELDLKPDLECKEIWKSIGVAESHIFALGMSENFWDMGETGPCGPCTEIHFDHDGRRQNLLELWNLVFMQFDRKSDGSLKPLPRRHVDTGMGLERITAMLQGSTSNYSTDLFQPLISRLAQEGKCGEYNAGDPVLDQSYRVVADHARMITVAVSDGLLPGRGETQGKLKHIIHRSVRHSRDILRTPQGTVGALVPVVVSTLGDAFPELRGNVDFVQSVVDETEHRYLQLIDECEKIVEKALVKFQTKPGDTVTCDQMYQVCDGRFGRQVPLDILTDILLHRNISCDSSYEQYLKQQRNCDVTPDLRREHLLDQHDVALLKSQSIPVTDISPVYNYQKLEGKYVFPSQSATVVAIKKGSELVEQVDDTGLQQVVIILDKTCFYAEKGGQVGDRGRISSVEGAVFEVQDTQELQHYVQHVGILHNGSLCVGAQVHCTLNQAHREGCMLNHSATHLLNFCLNKVCGGVLQQGSLVTPDSLHFEFTTHQLEFSTDDVIEEVTSMSNNLIESCLPLNIEEMDFQRAKNVQGLTYLKSTRYPGRVRVVCFGGSVEDAEAGRHSKELCSGTHVLNTGDVGAVCVTGLEGDGLYSKRLVAVTGQRAKQAISEGRNLKEKVFDLRTMVNDKTEKDQLISMRNEIGQLLGASVIPRVDRQLIGRELSALDRSLGRAAAGRARIHAEIQQGLAHRASRSVLVMQTAPAKTRDVVKVLADFDVDFPVVILFQNIDQKSFMNAVCLAPNQGTMNADIISKQVIKLTQGTSKAPNKVHKKEQSDMLIVRFDTRNDLDNLILSINSAIECILNKTLN